MMKMQQKTLRVSASKLSTYKSCPKQIRYKYIQKLPTLDQDYFKYGHDAEDNFKTLLDGGEVDPDNLWGRAALKLFEDPKVQEIFKNGYTTYQREYKYIRDIDNKTVRHKLEKDERSHPRGGSIGIIGYTDFETDDMVVDMKTSAGNWGESNIEYSRRQSKIYNFFSGKSVAFIITNKKTFKPDVMTVTVENHDDLRDLIDEFEQAYRSEILFKSPSFLKCKFCPFAQVCKNDIL